MHREEDLSVESSKLLQEINKRTALGATLFGRVAGLEKAATAIYKIDLLPPLPVDMRPWITGVREEDAERKITDWRRTTEKKQDQEVREHYEKVIDDLLTQIRPSGS